VAGHWLGFLGVSLSGLGKRSKVAACHFGCLMSVLLDFFGTKLSGLQRVHSHEV